MELLHRLTPSTREKHIRERIKRNALVGLFHVPVLMLFLFANDIEASSDPSKKVIVFLAALNGFIRFVHFFLIRNQRTVMGRWARRHWLVLYRATIIGMGCAWTAMFTFAYIYSGLSFATVMILFALAAVCGSAIAEHCMDLPLLMLFQATMWLPPMVIFTSYPSAGPQSYYLTLCLFVYLLFNLSLGYRTNRWYWTSVLQQEDLATHRDELQSVLNAIPGFVFWLDMNLFYLGINDHMAQTLGKTASEFVGKQLGFAGAGDPIVTAARLFACGQKMEQVVELQVGIQSVQTWVLVVFRKFVDYNGSRILVIILNIQDRKSAEALLKQAQEKNALSERLSLIGAMAGGLAHEINNPLAIIQGRLEQVQTLLDRDDVNRISIHVYVAKALATVDRIARLMRGLRLMARGEQGHSFEKVFVRAIASEAFERVGAQAESAGVLLRLEDFAEDLQIECNCVQISQVLVNLIQNAFDEIKNQDERWISVGARLHGKTVEIRVTDSGKGIAPDLADQLFIPFFTTKPAGQGAGLGLSISKTIAERHGGSLRLTHDEVHTCFVLSLPQVLAERGDGQNAA